MEQKRELNLLFDRIHYVRSELRRENHVLRQRIEDLEDIVSRYLETPAEMRREKELREQYLIQRAKKVIDEQRDEA